MEYSILYVEMFGFLALELIITTVRNWVLRKVLLLCID